MFRMDRRGILRIWRRLGPAVRAFAALGMLGGGGWLLHPAAGLRAVGGLIWLDLSIGRREASTK